MSEETKLQSFLCASADWEVVIDNVASFEEAAALALQKQLDSESQKFAVGAVISVIPIVKKTKQARLLYSPAVLADVGMHKYADELVRHIDNDNNNNENGQGK